MLAVLFVYSLFVIRYSKVLRVRARSGEGPSNYGDQSYVALNDDAYDNSLDDSALLRPPPNADDADLMT